MEKLTDEERKGLPLDEQARLFLADWAQLQSAPDSKFLRRDEMRRRLIAEAGGLIERLLARLTDRPADGSQSRL